MSNKPLQIDMTGRPSWIVDEDDMPHVPSAEPRWNESMLFYVYTPQNGVGVYFHFRHVPEKGGLPGIWDVLLYVTLPNGKCLVTKLFAPGEVRQEEGIVGSLHVGGFSWVWKKAFEESTVRFRGAGRLVSDEELKAGPLKDGLHTQFDVHLDMSALTPPWDHWVPEQPEYSASYSKRFFAHQFAMKGTLRVGEDEYVIDGKGLRDHSWGPREFAGMGYVTWIHAQADSGRSFCVTYCPPTSKHPGMWDRKTGDASGIHCTTMEDLPLATTPQEAMLPTGSFKLGNPDGSVSEVKLEVIRTMYLSYRSPSEFCIGQAEPGDGATHVSFPAYAKVDWGGEQCYGLFERDVFLVTE